MVKIFGDILRDAERQGMKTVAVASAADEAVLEAICRAHTAGLIRAYLVGEKDKIEKIAKQKNYDLSSHEIIHETDKAETARKAVLLVREGRAQILMKGFLESSAFIKAIINKEDGLRKKGAPIAAVAILEIKGMDRLLFITDPGFIPRPSQDDKIHMVHNTVQAMHRLGIERPKVAMLCASETVNPKIEATVEAAAVADLFNRNEKAGCVVAGPISFDLAMSKDSVAHKGYTHPVAGKADLLVVPNIETGNAMLKAIQFCSPAKTGGLVTGAECPIVFSSRSDSAQTKMHTLALAVLTA